MFPLCFPSFLPYFPSYILYSNTTTKNDKIIIIIMIIIIIIIIMMKIYIMMT